MKTIKVMLAVSALLMFGGCIAVPVGPGYYSAPAYYGPSIGIGVYGGGRGGYGGGRGGYRGHR